MGSSIRSEARRRRVRVAWFCVAAALLAAGPARAAEPAEAKAKVVFKKGKTAYNLGRFEEALKAYSDAYELTPMPAFLFNIAQCHKQLGNWERAIFFYKRYLDMSPPSKDTDTVRKLIQDCDVKLAEQRRKDAEAERIRAEKAAGRAAAENALLLNPPPPADPAVGGLTASGNPAPAPELPAYKKWWFWTAIGSAVAIAAGGATAYVLTRPKPATMSLGTLDAR